MDVENHRIAKRQETIKASTGVAQTDVHLHDTSFTAICLVSAVQEALGDVSGRQRHPQGLLKLPHTLTDVIFW